MIQTFASTPRVVLPHLGAPLSAHPVETAPTLSVSVVIAWVNSLALISKSLDALRAQTNAPGEIIVVTRHDDARQAALRRDYPEITLLAAPRDMPITALRSRGIRRAHGDIVAVTEDHCSPSPEWIQTIRERMETTRCAVIGGVVENARTERLRDWAAFLTEYAGAVRSDVDENAAQALPGNNVAYRRSVIAGLSETLARGQWESFYHRELERKNAALYFEPNLTVLHDRPFDFFYFLWQRFHFSRSFAAMRNQSFTPIQRVKYGAACVILPPVLLLRGFVTLFQKQRHVARYLQCLPLIALYVTAGAVGESIGYFFGGGNSLRMVE
ncbi:MAG: glycosyltransferase [Chloroflexi bacterium]|nr:glycosyltransferase [Chloroflexota bacterium]